MKLVIWLSIFAIVFPATAAAQQPQIAANGVVNAASNAHVGSPNSSIAQGSIFTIYGTNLGPTSSPALAYPLQTTLGGVSVQVVSGSTNANAIPIFVGPNQINAILPGSIAVGVASLTVTYNGQTSNPATVLVAANSFGIFTEGSSQAGPGIITNGSNQLYSVTSPANPGDAAIIWGTGLGASPGDNGSAPPEQIDMPNLPLSVYVGTQQVTVTYRGRSTFTGEDQINFVVPAGITGCYVPVAVEIGPIVSNFATMPIAPAGQSCPDPTTFLGISDQPETGNVTLMRSTTIGTSTSTSDSGLAYFGSPQFLASPFLPPIYGNPYSLPTDVCIVGVLIQGAFDVLGSPPLDAGPAITVTGPNGSEQLMQGEGGYYSAQFGSGFLGAGAYTASAPGGTEVAPFTTVGAFSQSFTIPQPLTWTNQANISAVDRSASLDVTWTGGDPNGTVQITGNFASFICNAKTSDQQFTIPAFVLLSLPISSGTLTGDLALSSTSTTPFTASGISSGTINSIVTISKDVTYY